MQLFGIQFDGVALLAQGVNWFVNGLFASLGWVVVTGTASWLSSKFRRRPELPYYTGGRIGVDPARPGSQGEIVWPRERR